MSTAAEGTSAPRATDARAPADIEPLLSGNAPEAPEAQSLAPEAEASKSSIWGWLRWRPRAASASDSSPDAEAPAIAEPRSSGASIPVIAEGAGPSGGGGEIEAAQLGGSPRGARPQPVCLICLEPLTSEDFQTGRAMSLDCHCRGELALRHEECAIKWARVKGDTTCELCKRPVGNLPALPPATAEPGTAGEAHDPQYLMEFAPTYADLLFDCVRVCWVAMIVGILFFELTLDAALWTGVVAGLAYCCMVKLMYRQHFAAMRRLQQQQAQAMAGSPAAAPVVVAV